MADPRVDKVIFKDKKIDKKDKVKNEITVEGANIEVGFEVHVKGKKKPHKWDGTITVILVAGKKWAAEVEHDPNAKEECEAGREIEQVTVTVTNPPTGGSGTSPATDVDVFKSP